MSLCAPEAVSSSHGINSFDCGKPTLNEWLVRHAMQAQMSGSAKTYVVTVENQVVGYYSLTVGQVDIQDAPERLRKGMGQYPIPVVILARLAVALSYQGKSVGQGMLQDAIQRTLFISEQAGVRALLTQPIDDEANRFYLRFGFEASPIQEKQLLLILKDARRLIARISHQEDPV